MPITPAVIEAANAFRTRLLQRERQSATALVRYYGASWTQIHGEITALSAEVQAMRAAGEEITQGKLMRLQRMRAIEAQVEREMERFTEFADGEITARQREAIASGERDAFELMRLSLPGDHPTVTVNMYRMPREAVENYVGMMQDGTPLRGLLEKYVGDAAQNLSETMVTGMVAGWNPKKVAREMRNSYGMALTDSLRLARTEQLRAYRTANLQSYNANSDIVTSWMRMSGRDDRVCAACILLDGTVYTLGESMDDHSGGRCFLTPITKTYAELGIDAPEPEFNPESGREWFERQDEATQRKIMGTGMYDAWQDGKFALEDIPHKIVDDVWGNSWVPKPLYELLGESGPVGSYAGWKAGTLTPEEQWLQAIIGAPGGVLDEPGTSDARMREWLRGDLSPLTGDRTAKNEIVTMLAEQTGIPYRDVNRFVAQWAETSNDADMRSLAIQEDAAKMLGRDLPQWQADKLIEALKAREARVAQIMRVNDWQEEATILRMRQNEPKYFPLMDSDKQQQLLRAMYDNTQARLDEAGIGDTIRLRRGMIVNSEVVEEWARQAGIHQSFVLNETVEYRGSMLESWSVDHREARNFALAKTRGEVGVVFEMDIPRARLIGSARSGFGCLNEQEFVHLGAFGDEQARILELWR